MWLTALYVLLLLAVLYWLRRERRERDQPPLGGIVRFSAEVDEMDLVLHWTNSTPAPAQAPLKHTLIEERLSETLPWAVVNIVSAGTQQLRIPEIERGRHHYRATEIDALDRPSRTRPEITVDVPFDELDGASEFHAEIVP